jgi:diguanylate cyclase (GGDEF)-like protein/PAS domain S-box-containing protein
MAGSGGEIRRAQERERMGSDPDFFRALVERSAVALIVAEPSGVVRWHTSPAARFLGGPLVHRPLQSICDPDDAERLSVYLHGLASLTTPTTVFLQVRMIHGDGSIRHLELTGANLLHEPEVGGLVLQVSDVTDRVEVERQLTRHAKEDTLTGLANRRVLTERLEHELARLEGIASGELGFLFIDLDRFKAINDLFGHSVGDQVLRHVAQRIASCIRPTDMAARFGGDEFGVVVGGRDQDDVIAVAERILGSLEEPITVDGTPLKVGASIGVATTGTARSVDRLYQQADAAMYRAKANGRGRTSIYDVDIAEWLSDRKDALAAVEGRARRLEIENRRLAEEVRTDAMTQLPNVIRQREDLEAAEDAALGRGVPFSVAFIDIDQFGLYNKRFGQDTGDDVLRRVADALRSACRESDTVYRRGGEEFVVIFRNTPAAAAVAIAERMCRQVSGSVRDVTVSVGVATFDPSRHPDGSATVADADVAMRQAKRSGGNQVMAFA